MFFYSFLFVESWTFLRRQPLWRPTWGCWPPPPTRPPVHGGGTPEKRREGPTKTNGEESFLENWENQEMVQNRVVRQNHYQIRIPRRILGIAKPMFMYNSSILTLFTKLIKFIHEIIKIIYEIE